MYKPEFDKILAIDVETSGLNSGEDGEAIAKGYQIVSIGLIVADTKFFKPIDTLYLEIKWDGISKWTSDAERIHGFSKKYLDINGVSEEDAVEMIVLFINKHFGIDKPLSLLGHNVQFDAVFLKQLLNKYNCYFKFSHRNVDTFSLGMPLLQAFNSNQLFEKMGFESRITHNSMQDIEMTLKACRLISKMWRDHLGEF